MKLKHLSNDIYAYKSTYSGSKIKNDSRFFLVFLKLFKKIFFIFGFISLILYLIFYSPIFKIKTIDFKDLNNSEITDEINTLIGKNIFTINTNNVKAKIIEKNPDLYEIKFIRGLPDTLKIETITRQESAIWKVGDKNYILDQNGQIFLSVKDAPTWNDAKVPIIFDARNEPINSNTRFISSSLLEKILQIKNAFSQNEKIIIKQIEVNGSIFQPIIRLEDNRFVKINLLESIDYQLEAINAVFSSDKTFNEYLDVRIAGIVYYK